jgi:hypothetical protein
LAGGAHFLLVSAITIRIAIGAFVARFLAITGAGAVASGGACDPELARLWLAYARNIIALQAIRWAVEARRIATQALSRPTAFIRCHAFAAAGFAGIIRRARLASMERQIVFHARIPERKETEAFGIMLADYAFFRGGVAQSSGHTVGIGRAVLALPVIAIECVGDAVWVRFAGPAFLCCRIAEIRSAVRIVSTAAYASGKQACAIDTITVATATGVELYGQHRVPPYLYEL